MNTLALLASAALLGACATPAPYAVVTGQRDTVSDPTVESVRIMGVNGRLDMAGSSEVRLEPGPAWLLVKTLRRDSRARSRDATVVLNAKPCMRYFVVARHESELAVEPWSPQVTQQEPIQACMDQFPTVQATSPAGAAAPASAASGP